ncbi:MAG: hypothetical protein JWM43_2098 [Acidobacteriaceae bacterium]|nr:hypothetical protein [Acidobacteriaceae bacterium]
MQRAAALLVGLICSIAFGQSTPADLKTLADAHRWVELRGAAAKDEHAKFFRGVAAAAFNEPQAESLFKSVIRDDPHSEEAYQAYDWLCNIYLKTGRYHSLAEIAEARWAAFPNKKSVASEKKSLAPFLVLPDQENGRLRVSTLHHDAKSFAVSLMVNHKSAKFFFDNGADVSCMSELEAKRLGMEIRETSGSMGTMTRDASFRTAVAHDVTIGIIHFKEVSFAIFPDDQEPWSLVPLGERGIIGLPLMIATGVFDWKADGNLTIGARPESLEPERANLFFGDGHHVFINASFQGQDIWTSLDSGAMTTDIYASFAERFADYLKKNGKSGSTELRGLGGAETYESIDVPELAFELGGRQVVLRPAHVYTKQYSVRKWVLGNFGKDLLTQTTGFKIDFGAMRLTIEAP